jgi:hypothetical protein
MSQKVIFQVTNTEIDLFEKEKQNIREYIQKIKSEIQQLKSLECIHLFSSGPAGQGLYTMLQEMETFLNTPYYKLVDFYQKNEDDNVVIQILKDTLFQSSFYKFRPITTYLPSATPAFAFTQGEAADASEGEGKGEINFVRNQILNKENHFPIEKETLVEIRKTTSNKYIQYLIDKIFLNPCANVT